METAWSLHQNRKSKVNFSVRIEIENLLHDSPQKSKDLRVVFDSIHVHCRIDHDTPFNFFCYLAKKMNFRPVLIIYFLNLGIKYIRRYIHSQTVIKIPGSVETLINCCKEIELDFSRRFTSSTLKASPRLFKAPRISICGFFKYQMKLGKPKYCK